MEDLKFVFSQNLIKLRKQHNLTQAELAEKLNYSDKAISKWERAEAIPDIYMLKQISVFFNITLDELMKEHRINENIESNVNVNYINKLTLINHLLILLISIISIWIIATLLFVIDSIDKTMLADKLWLWFILPIPISFLIAFILSCVWMNKITRVLLLSGFGWTLLLLVFLTLVPYWEIFLIGIPIEIVIVLSYGIFKVSSLKQIKIFNRKKVKK